MTFLLILYGAASTLRMAMIKGPLSAREAKIWFAVACVLAVGALVQEGKRSSSEDALTEEVQRSRGEISNLRSELAKAQEFNKGQISVLAQLGSKTLAAVLEGGESELREELAALQEQFGPRRITQEKKDLLIQRLKGRDNGCVLTITTFADKKTESAKYAADFIEVFEKAGWRPQIKRLSGVRENVYLSAKPGEPTAEFLLNQFRQPDIAIEVIWYPLDIPGQKEKSINLIVGPRQIR